MRRPALIFDFGNVVGFFDYTRAFEAIARPRGLRGEDLLRDARQVGLDDLIARFERGEISAEGFSRAGGALLGSRDVTAEEFAAAWADIFWPNESILPLIRRLHDDGHRLVLGSNTNALHAARFRAQFSETLGRFDRLVLSYEIGHMKPSAEFYRACVEAAGAEPGDCLFIDDLPENVEGARRAGLIGLPYRDTPTLEADLRGLGLLAEPDRP